MSEPRRTRTTRPSESKLHFGKGEDGKVSLFKINGPMKKNEMVLGDIIDITAARKDKKDEKLKVF